MISVDSICFDLDGTLIDSKRDLAKSVQVLQAYYRVPISTEKQVAAFIGDGVVKLVERALPAHPPERMEEAVLKFKRYYRDHCLDHTKIYPGVMTTLNYFRHKKLAVVTNKPVRVSGYLLDCLGLSPYFKVLIGGDSLPNKKPHPEPLLSALKTMGVRQSARAVMVGDSPMDVEAGKAARTYTCGLRSNIGDVQKLLNSKPDFLISNLKEMTRLFS